MINYKVRYVMNWMYLQLVFTFNGQVCFVCFKIIFCNRQIWFELGGRLLLSIKPCLVDRKASVTFLPWFYHWLMTKDLETADSIVVQLGGNTAALTVQLLDKYGSMDKTPNFRLSPQHDYRLHVSLHKSIRQRHKGIFWFFFFFFENVNVIRNIII